MASQSLKHEEPDLKETQLQIQQRTATLLVTPDHALAMTERGVLTEHAQGTSLSNIFSREPRKVFL